MAGTERPIRAWSWIVTIYGDVVVPRGGELALGSLLACAKRSASRAGWCAPR